MKKGLKMVILGIFMAALICGYYFMSNREVKNADDDVEVTDLDEVLAKKLDQSYPPTPREVVKFYNRIIECAYGDEDYDDAQFDQLAEQARKLMDDELLESNPQEDYKNRLKQEIASYKNNSQKILQTSVCDSDEVKFREIDGRKCAYVQASYFTKQGKGDFFKANENYLLRKDSDGNWKILAYKLTDSEEETEVSEELETSQAS